MRSLRSIPIKRKLILITMLTSGVALLLACGAFLGYERHVYRNSLIDELSSTAAIVGDNSAASLAFEEPGTAEQTLSSLKIHPHIVAAAIYDSQGNLFATYRSTSAAGVDVPNAPQASGHRFDADSLRYTRPIELAGETAGTVYIHSDLTEMQQRMQRYGMIVALVLAAASGTALLLSTILHRSISDPLSHLTSVVNAVAQEQTHSIRAVRHGDDELGQLIDGFNAMLDQIQQRETALQEAHDSLDRRVRERTSELQKSLALLNATLQATADGVVATQYETGLVCYNRQYQDMWGLPDELLARSGVDATQERIALMAAQVVDPEAYVARIQEIRGAPHAFDVLQFKDGRTVERYVRPQELDGRTVGMVVNFRDVTERKRAEDELLNAHKQLVETSRQAGMAEVATGVLHNVGNVLNSVNVSANLVIDIAKRSKAASLSRVAKLVREREHDLGAFIASDPNGKHLPAFLIQLSQLLVEEQAETIKELESLRSNIDHIKEIVAMQQSYAKISGVKEVVEAADLVEDSIRMNASALQRHGVQVVREIAPVPPLNIEKHKVLQILVNLVRNAKFACSESGRVDKRITVRVSAHEDRARVEVIDNGIGIAPANLTRIFNHGFTTRRDGHGFGLHSGALAAREVGGALYADSDGPGRGATFTLELPLAMTEASHLSPAQAASA